MFVSKILIWSIHFCCVIKFSFSSFNFNKEYSLLFKNYSKSVLGRRQICPDNVLLAKKGDITATIDGEEILKWNSANGIVSTQENENPMLNKLQSSSRLSALTPENVDEKRGFFVITAIFNPASYKSRYNLYHKFAKHMYDTGAQLITIECIFPSLNQTKFEVTEANNPWHIQLKSESVYWMKENLINIAVSRLPTNAKWISWLDADIEFEEKNWIELTINELKNYTVVQIFEKAKFLGPSPKTKVLRVDYSFGHAVNHNQSFNIKTYGTWYPHPGYGWAMSVNCFREIKGLPDYNIVGSGDRFFAYSLLNRISDSFMHNELEIPSALKYLISDLANQTFKTLHDISKSNYKAIVGYVPVTIRHHWHGSTKNRQYMERWNIFINNNFDFKTDISANEDGLFQLTQNKPKLQKDLLTYFEMRHEDETVTYIQDDSKMCKVRFFYEGGRQRKKSVSLIARMLRFLGLGWIFRF